MPLDFNSLLIQWGNFPETNGYNNTNTFPVAFKSKYFLGVSQQRSNYSVAFSGGWTNNTDGSLTNFGAGIGNDVTPGTYPVHCVSAIFIGI